MSTSKEISTRQGMTHHHQKQVQHDTQWLNKTNNYARPWLITTNKQFKTSEQLFKHIVHDISSKRCSGQLSYNYSRILFKKDNNSRTVQGSLLFSTVPLLTWLQSKFNTKQQ